MGRNVTAVAWKHQCIPLPVSDDVVWGVSSREGRMGQHVGSGQA